MRMLEEERRREKELEEMQREGASPALMAGSAVKSEDGNSEEDTPNKNDKGMGAAASWQQTHATGVIYEPNLEQLVDSTTSILLYYTTMHNIARETEWVALSSTQESRRFETAHLVRVAPLK